MYRFPRLALAAAVVCAAPAAAQRYLVTQTSPAMVHLVDVEAGPIFEYGFLSLPTFGLNQIYDAALVGNEIWVTSSSVIHRFDAVSHVEVGVIQVGTGLRGLQPIANGAWVARLSGTLERYDLAGNPVITVPATSPLDVFMFNGELLVSNDSDHRIDRYDSNGVFLGALTANGLGIGIDFLGIGFLAERPSTGNILLVSNLRIFEIDATSGAIVDTYQAGNFEQSVIELADARLLSINAFDATIFDPAVPVVSGTTIPTTGTHSLRGVSPYDSGNPGIRRYCTASANSAGSGASISARGTTNIADGSLWLDAIRGPANTFGVFVYGHPAAAQVFGDGVLCLGSGAPVVVRTNTIGNFTPTGDRLSVELPYASFPATAPVTAGSSWAFQYAYRDAAAGGTGFNATDAIWLTFN